MSVALAVTGIALMLYVTNRSVASGRCGRPSAPVIQFLIGAVCLGLAFVTSSDSLAGARQDGRKRRGTILATIGLVVVFIAVIRLMARTGCGS